MNIMKNDGMMREVDRRHMLQLFDLFSDSEYDTFELIRGYSELDSRMKAAQGSEYHILNYDPDGNLIEVGTPI